VKAKPVVPRERADRDVDEAVGYDLEEEAPHAAEGLIDALERAYAHIGRHPATDSPRYGHELGLPDLRFWPLGKFPFLVVYVEREDHVDVWRVLHEERDIPAWLRSASSDS